MLIFACVTLTAATGILFSTIPLVYSDEDLEISVLNPHEPPLIPEGFPAQVLRSQQKIYSFMVLAWTTIFAVKICFLLFFVQMVDRLKKLMFIWKIAFGITMLFYCFCVSAIFIACPYFGLNLDACKSGFFSANKAFFKAKRLTLSSFIALVKCISGPAAIINLAFSASEIVVDIITDLLSKFFSSNNVWLKIFIITDPQNTVIMIPILLLWKLKISRNQKILFGIFLCLSLFMIMIAIVRISGVKVLLWILFWLEIEATVAVIMVSITAFRSLLGMKAIRSREKKERAGYWYRQQRQSKEKIDSSSDSNEVQLPSIPGATLTGIRTLIRGTGDSETVASRIDETDITSSRDVRMHMEKQTKATKKLSSESEIVRFSQARGSTQPRTIFKLIDLYAATGREFDYCYQISISHTSAEQKENPLIETGLCHGSVSAR